MKRSIWIATFLLLALLLAACGDTGTGSTAPNEVSEGQEPGKNRDGYVDLDTDQLAAMLENKDFTMVNVHIPYQGEIPETDLFIPFDEIEDHLDELPAKDAPIVLYCRSGSMSTTAARVLVDQGYTNVMELDGGFVAWEAEGYQLLHRR